MKSAWKKAFYFALLVLALTALFVVGTNAATLDDQATNNTSSAVAKVGNDAYYTTFAKAFEAANATENGATITLLTNINLGTITDPYTDLGELYSNNKNHTNYFFHVQKPIVIDGQSKYSITASGDGFLFRATANFTLQNVTVNYVPSEGYAIIIERSTWTSDILISNATLYSSGNAIHLEFASIDASLTIKNDSEIIAKNNALYLAGGTELYDLTVENSLLTAGDVVIYVYNADPVFSFKADAVIDGNSSKLSSYEITPTDAYAIDFSGKHVRGQIRMYSNAIIKGNGTDIYWSSSDKTSTKAVYFGEDYSGAYAVRKGGTGSNCYYEFFTSLQDALAADYTYFELNQNVTFDQAIAVSRSTNVIMANVIDTNGNTVAKTYTMTYTGDGSAFVLNTVTTTLTLTNINVEATTAVDISKELKATGSKLIVDGTTYRVLGGISITHADNTVSYYATLSDAIAVAVDGEIITLLSEDATLTEVVSKAITIDVHGHILSVRGDAIGSAVVTSADAMIVNGAISYYANFASVVAIANTFENGGTIRLISDVTITDLTEALIFTKPIVIDGAKSDGAKYKIFASNPSGHVFDAYATFTLKNIDLEATAVAKGYAIVAREDVTATIYNSQIIAHAGTALGADVVCNWMIDSSTVVALTEPAMYISAAPLITIKDSYMVGGGNYGILDVYNGNPIIDLKGNTYLDLNSPILVEYDITQKPRASIRMRGDSPCNPIITLYDSASLTAGSQSYIYYTEGKGRTDKYVRFASNYTGAAFIAISAIANGGTVTFCEFLEDAIALGRAVIRVCRNVTIDTTVNTSQNANIESATIIDASTGKVIVGKTCTVTYTGTDSMFVLGNFATSIQNVNINAANGTAFTLNGVETTVTLTDVTVTANKDANASAELKATGYRLVVDDTTYQIALCDASITHADNSTSYYTTLTDAIVAALEGDVVTLLTNVTVNNLTVNKAITVDLGGMTLNGSITIAANVTVKNGTIVTSGTAFTLTEGAALVLNSISVTGNVLSGTVNNNVTTNSVTLAEQIRAAGYAVIEASGIYTVTCKLDLSEIKKAIKDANSAMEGVLVTAKACFAGIGNKYVVSQSIKNELIAMINKATTAMNNAKSQKELDDAVTELKDAVTSFTANVKDGEAHARAKDCSTVCKNGCGQPMPNPIQQHTIQKPCIDEKCSECGEHVQTVPCKGLKPCSDKCQWCEKAVVGVDCVGNIPCTDKTCQYCGGDVIPVPHTQKDGAAICSTTCRHCNLPNKVSNSNEHDLPYPCTAACMTCGEVNLHVEEHNYPYSCTAACTVCGKANPHVEDHSFPHPCTVACTVCGKANPHVENHNFPHPCTAACTACGEANPHTQEHNFPYLCTTACTVCGKANPHVEDHNFPHPCAPACIACGEANPDMTPHVGEFPCSKKCMYNCGTNLGNAEKHEGEFACSTTCKHGCNIAITDAVEHAGKYECSPKCRYCGKEINAKAHQFDNDCDTDCNVCKLTREVTHSYKNNHDDDCELCGLEREDEGGVKIWMIIVIAVGVLTVGGAAIAVLLVKKKKQ